LASIAKQWARADSGGSALVLFLVRCRKGFII
jgi:hypothetical protein